MSPDCSFSLQIAPLERITPSGFIALSHCHLRAACQAARQPALLPQSPSGLIGTVSHMLLERAGKGEATGSAEEFAKLWDELVQRAEAKWQVLPLQRHLVPLRQHISHYEVLRWRACKRAAYIAAQIATVKGTPSAETIRVFHEEPVATPDGTIAGVIDYVRETSEGTVLRDYKSGTIWEKDTAPDGPDLLKAEYQTQLRMYAALWWSRSGVWPVRLELAPLDGDPVEVPFEPDECIHILSEARSALARVNADIKAALQSSPPDTESLATPAARVCRYCTFRPSCPAYWRHRDGVSTEEAKEWPRDVRGTIQRKQVLGNGQVMLQLLNVQGQKVSVRLKPSSGQHPSLDGLDVGDGAALYNLAPAGAETTFKETAYTAVYPSTAS